MSYRVITYHIVTILSCLCGSLLQLEWVKSYRVTLYQHNYQMPSVTSFVLGFFFKSGNSLYETSVQFRMKFIGAETRADLEVQYMYEYVS